MVKQALLVMIGLAALVLNPFFGCGDKSFRYGADEMRAAVEGTWKLAVPATTETPAHEIVLSISQAAEPDQQHSRRAGPVADAAACAQRSLVKSAGACADTSEMPVDIKLLATGASAKGMFLVVGLKFIVGKLDADLGTTTLLARLAPDGSITELQIGGQDAPAGSMTRVSTAQR